MKQPVLEVSARDKADIAKRPLADQLVDVLVERVEADVEVDRADPAAPCSQLHQLRRLGRSDGQRLLADHVPPSCEDRFDLGVMERVGGGDVDDLHPLVTEQLFE